MSSAVNGETMLTSRISNYHMYIENTACCNQNGGKPLNIQQYYIQPASHSFYRVPLTHVIVPLIFLPTIFFMT